MKQKLGRELCATFIMLSIACATVILSPYASLVAKTTHRSIDVGGVTVTRPTCEYGSNPIAVGTTRPRLSWQIESDMRDVVQLAYRIIASSSPERLSRNDGNMWDTKKVTSDNTLNLVYAGKKADEPRDLLLEG